MKKFISLMMLTTVIFSQTGLEIAEQINTRKTPKDMSSDLTMVLRNKSGQTRTSKIHSVTMGGGEKQIIWFLAPADDKGVAFLKIEHEGKDDEMRMWLPAFKKVRRISSKKKGDSFMGSDMSYEDMSNRELSDHSYERLADEALGETECYVLEITPKKEIKSNYSKHIAWVEKTDLIPLKEESYDVSGKLKKSKTFAYTEIKEYVVPTEIFVEDVQRKHTTKLTFESIELDTGVDSNLFHEKSLKRLPRK